MGLDGVVLNVMLEYLLTGRSMIDRMVWALVFVEAVKTLM
jgi:hypothetical protein